MNAPDRKLLSEVEEILKEKFDVGESSRVPSTAQPAEASARLGQLVLPKEARPRMPLTQDKWVIKEDPHLVEWERITRQFLRELSPAHGHRISAVMVYEWATGIKVKELQESGGSASPDLRKISKVLRHHFDKPYSTYIAGRKVANAYRVPQGWLVKRHRPMTITLYAEYQEGTLNP